MIISTEKPYKIFAEVLEQGAIDQFESAMQQDFVVQGALMPDAHAGYSLPIGAVVATDGIILPASVIYSYLLTIDKGCGMFLCREEHYGFYKKRDQTTQLGKEKRICLDG